jgi:hypothetical protein
VISISNYELYILANCGFDWETLAEIYFKIRGYETSERALYLKVYRETKESLFKFNQVEFIEIATQIIEKYKIKEKLSN